MRVPQSLAGYLGKYDVAKAPDEALVKVRSLKAAMAQILSLLPTPGGGVAVRRTLTGDVWGLILPAAHNWQPMAVSNTTLTLSPGKVNGVYPTITPSGGSATSVNTTPRPALTVDATALNYVYLKVPVTKVISSGFVESATQGSPVIEAATTEPTSTQSNRYFTLFTWQEGKLVSQISFGNIGWKAEDDQTATSNAVFRDWMAA